jgi:hypothetical protein
MDTRPLKRFLAAAVLVGGIVPIVLLATWYFGSHTFGAVEFWLWPSGLMMLVTNGRDHLDAFSVIVVVTNMMLYFIAGFVVWQIYRAGYRCVARFTNKA